MRVPRPQVRTSHFGTLSIGYSVSFFVDRFEAAAGVKSEVLALIHRHAEWAGVSLGRAGRIVHSDTETSGSPREQAQLESILDRIPLFQELSASEREALDSALGRREFADGKTLFEQGQPGDSLFLIGEGVVSVSAVDGRGATEEMGRLGPGDLVGANAVLTGAPRTETARTLTRATLYELRQESIAPLLKEHPALREQLTSLLPQPLASDRAAAIGLDSGDGAKARPRLFERVARLFNPEAGP